MKHNRVIEYLSISVCAIALAFCYILFIVPNQFAPAGLNGIATMVQYKLGFSIGYFSLLINVPLCALAYVWIDRVFAIKSLVFCLVYSGSYLVLQQIDTTAIQYNAQGIDTIFPCLIAGLIGGAVYGVCFRVSASTGGTDIVAKWINKQRPTLDFFWVTFVINACVAFASLFVYTEQVGGGMMLNYKPVCLCVLYCFMSSFMGNKMLQGHKSAYQFIIMTTHAAEIEREILQTLHHSATRLHGEGIYTGKEKEILICVVNKHQLVEFKRILARYEDTFATVGGVSEIVGNFKQIK